MKQTTAKTVEDVLNWIETKPHHYAASDEEPGFFILKGRDHKLRIPDAIHALTHPFVQPGGEFDRRMYRATGAGLARIGQSPLMHLHHDEEMDKFLEGVVGAIEATSEEQHNLWKRWSQELGKTWEQVNPGLLPTIGSLAGMPICLSLSKVKVNGAPILFYYASSQVVDHRVVEKWIECQLPASAKSKDGRINKSDATNAHIVLNGV